MEAVKSNAVNAKNAVSSIISRTAVSPANLITDASGRWTTESYTYLIVYVFMFILCFILSLSNYQDDDPTPYGHRILYAISAGLWNILYLVYYALFRF
jgi:hypothetical protein